MLLVVAGLLQATHVHPAEQLLLQVLSVSLHGKAGVLGKLSALLKGPSNCSASSLSSDTGTELFLGPSGIPAALALPSVSHQCLL